MENPLKYSAAVVHSWY